MTETPAFRSQLHARWAKAFTQAGWYWHYEPCGSAMKPADHRPDFFVATGYRDNDGERRFWQEEFFLSVRHARPPLSASPVVYMAGKMGDPVAGWRGWRPEGLPDWPVDGDEPDFEYPFPMLHRYGGFSYSGPFGDWMGKHSERHGADYVWNTAEGHVLKRSFRGIDAATHVLVLLDKLDAYGTLVEIGYAKAKGKKIAIAVVGTAELLKETSYTDRHGCERHALTSEGPFVELWFALKTADAYKCFEHPDAALEWLLGQAGCRPIPEIDFSRSGFGLSKWAVAFGEPHNFRAVGHQFSLPPAAARPAAVPALPVPYLRYSRKDLQ